jgi:hypothetical protein
LPASIPAGALQRLKIPDLAGPTRRHEKQAEAVGLAAEVHHVGEVDVIRAQNDPGFFPSFADDALDDRLVRLQIAGGKLVLTGAEPRVQPLAEEHPSIAQQHEVEVDVDIGAFPGHVGHGALPRSRRRAMDWA